MLLRPTSKYKELLPPLTLPQIDSTLKIGRSILMTDDISIPIPEMINHVSRHHLDIITRRKQVYLVPMSTQQNLVTLNGTALNNGREVELKAGDVFTLLPNLFTYELITNSKAPQIQPLTQTEEIDQAGSNEAKDSAESNEGIENSESTVVVNEETDTQEEVILEGETPPVKIQQQPQVFTDSTDSNNYGDSNESGSSSESKAEAPAANLEQEHKDIEEHRTLDPLTKSTSTSSSSSLLDGLTCVVNLPTTINLVDSNDSNEKEPPTEAKQEKEEDDVLPLPSLSRQTSNESNTSMVDSLLSSSECPICFETLLLSYTTKCSHSFCYTCLCDIWDSGHRSCPTCSQSFELDQCVHNRFADEITFNIMTDIATRTGNDEDMKAWNERLAAAKVVEKERKSAEAAASNNKSSKKKSNKKTLPAGFLEAGRQVNANAARLHSLSDVIASQRAAGRITAALPNSNSSRAKKGKSDSGAGFGLGPGRRAAPQLHNRNNSSSSSAASSIFNLTDNLAVSSVEAPPIKGGAAQKLGNSSSSSSDRKRKREQNRNNMPMPAAKDYSGEVIDLT